METPENDVIAQEADERPPLQERAGGILPSLGYGRSRVSQNGNPPGWARAAIKGRRDAFGGLSPRPVSRSRIVFLISRRIMVFPWFTTPDNLGQTPDNLGQTWDRPRTTWDRPRTAWDNLGQAGWQEGGAMMGP